MTKITDEKKREAMDALGRALDVAMYQTLAASIPACGAFGAIAQDLDFAFPILTAALSPAPQALAGEAEWSPTGDEQASWYARMSDEDRRIANAIMREGCAEHARLTRALRDAEIASGIDIATLRARVAELEAGQDWWPIETAPRDDVVLLYGFLQPLSADKELYANLDHPRRVTGYWSPIDEAWSIIGGTWEGPFFSPTHWHPLPTPPASQEGQADG